MVGDDYTDRLNDLMMQLGDALDERDRLAERFEDNLCLIVGYHNPADCPRFPGTCVHCDPDEPTQGEQS